MQGLSITRPARHLDGVAAELEMMVPWQWTEERPIPAFPTTGVAAEILIPFDILRETAQELAMLAQAAGLARVEHLLRALVEDALGAFRRGSCFRHLRKFRERFGVPLEWAPGSEPR